MRRESPRTRRGDLSTSWSVPNILRADAGSASRPAKESVLASFDSERHFTGTIVAGCAAMGRILVVDDDSSTVWAMTMLLRQDGHQVVSFTSGYDAVSALRVGPPFDAVVTDFEMPSVNGVAVARAAREYSRARASSSRTGVERTWACFMGPAYVSSWKSRSNTTRWSA